VAVPLTTYGYENDLAINEYGNPVIKLTSNTEYNMLYDYDNYVSDNNMNMTLTGNYETNGNGYSAVNYMNNPLYYRRSSSTVNGITGVHEKFSFPRMINYFIGNKTTKCSSKLSTFITSAMGAMPKQLSIKYPIKIDNIKRFITLSSLCNLHFYSKATSSID